jgi:hypothetical protein
MDLNLLNQAHQNWENFLNTLGDDQKKALDELNQPIAANDVHYYAAVSDYAKFDQIISKLSDNYLYDEELIPTIYQVYLDRDLNELAFEYLMSSQAYLEKAGISVPSNIKLLYEYAENIKLLKKYRDTLDRIRSIAPANIAKITPEVINNKRELNKFILFELIQALLILDDKRAAIKQITHENRFNDFLQAILKLRLPIWGWSIHDQSRIGSSSSGKDAGSADILIQSGGGRNIALVEALILRDRAYTELHILKCPKYIATINKYYIVVYHLEPSVNFDSNWQSYQTDVLAISYPSDFQIENTIGFKDLNSEFEDIRNFKIAMTSHPNGIELYHIMINLGD